VLAAVDAYSLALFVHIAAVVVGFGSTYALAVTFPVAMQVGTQHLPYMHRLGVVLNKWFATPALLLILVTGLYQVAEDDGRGWGYDDPWISATFAILIVLGGLAHGYFIPTEKRLGEMAERDLASGATEMSPEYMKKVRNSGIMGALAGVLILVAVFLMVTKPGA
jgi:uncharacterized membrane protein